MPKDDSNSKFFEHIRKKYRDKNPTERKKSLVSSINSKILIALTIAGITALSFSTATKNKGKDQSFSGTVDDSTSAVLDISGENQWLTGDIILPEISTQNPQNQDTVSQNYDISGQIGGENDGVLDDTSMSQNETSTSQNKLDTSNENGANKTENENSNSTSQGNQSSQAPSTSVGENSETSGNENTNENSAPDTENTPQNPMDTPVEETDPEQPIAPHDITTRDTVTMQDIRFYRTNTFKFYEDYIIDFLRSGEKYRNLPIDAETLAWVKEEWYQKYDSILEIFEDPDGNGGKIYTLADFCINKDIIDRYESSKKVEKYVEDAVKVLGIEESMTQWEAMLRIYKYVIDMAEYDNENLTPLTSDLFENGKAVCAGYSDAFVQLSRYCGIDAYKMKGRFKGMVSKHAVALVKFSDGSVRYVDPTYGDGYDFKTSVSSYFLKDHCTYGLNIFDQDKEFYENHEFSIDDKHPELDGYDSTKLQEYITKMQSTNENNGNQSETQNNDTQSQNSDMGSENVNDTQAESTKNNDTAKDENSTETLPND